MSLPMQTEEIPSLAPFNTEPLSKSMHAVSLHRPSQPAVSQAVASTPLTQYSPISTTTESESHTQTHLLEEQKPVK